MPVLLCCGAVVLPLVSLQHDPEPGNTASRMDASPSSLELAARLAPQRASRSAGRDGSSSAKPIAVRAMAKASTKLDPTTTSTVYVIGPGPDPAIHGTTSTTAKPTPTTRKRTTSTTRKPRSTTTTTAKPRPSSPPQMRPWTPPTPGQSTGQSEMGQATWYRAPDPAMCAHKTLPFGTVLTVVNTGNNKTTTCRVGDRGPFVEGRILDLSPEAFSVLAPLSEGVINVRIEW